MVANTHPAADEPLRVPATGTVGAEEDPCSRPRADAEPADGGPGTGPREIGRRLVRRTTFIVVSPRAGPWLVPRDGRPAPPRLDRGYVCRSSARRAAAS